MAQVGKMAFEALKAAIPPALIALLVERLVSMIVPAAGAVMAVVQGLMAAWGAIQKILAAIDRFIAFLKAVKSGGAGPAFANALAAAAVAVIEFVSQFLLRKIAGAAGKVAGKIKAIAQKIGKKLMAGLKKVGKKIKRGATQAQGQGLRQEEEGPEEEGQGQEEGREGGQAEAPRRRRPRLRPKIRGARRQGRRSLRMKAQLLYWKLAQQACRGLWVEQARRVRRRPGAGEPARPTCPQRDLHQRGRPARACSTGSASVKKTRRSRRRSRKMQATSAPRKSRTNGTADPGRAVARPPYNRGESAAEASRDQQTSEHGR